MNRAAIRIGIMLVGAAVAGFTVARLASIAHSSDTGRATVVLPMTPSSRSRGIDPTGMTISTRFAPPEGFERVPEAKGSYGTFLRDLPVKPPGSPVRLFDGRWKARQDVHAAVIDLDLGPRDLQQCADSVIRLRAMYLHAAGRRDEISFHFTSGFPCAFSEWRRGKRIVVTGNDVRWMPGGAIDASAAALREYLEIVYTYAGTASLPRDVEPVAAVGLPEPGDIYLQPGSPGHTMTVVDVASRGDARVVLLAQGYMPAQDVHVVRNPASREGDAWFAVGQGPVLVTPEWRFAWSALRRFKEGP